MVLLQYQRWPSENLFFCWGHCITGPAEDWPFRIAFALVVFIPTILFFGFESNHLWKISPPTVLVPLALFVLLVINWLLCACIDPGILPRGSKENNKENSTTLEVQEGDQKVVYKWCFTCNVWRPPRASHCSDCNNCVLEHDHHCPVIGTCIGVRNVKFFLLTIFFGFALVMFILVDTIVFFVTRHPSHQTQTLALVFAVILGVLVGVPLAAFASFHFLMLLLSGQTTKEWVKRIGVSERKTVCSCERSRIFPRKPLILVANRGDTGGDSSDGSEVGLEELVKKDDKKSQQQYLV
eukprot:c11605_g2_i1.p1 GENE.c11605_g2_i1~~c11605_g2_i1.p1  ORF type:complete len:295 (-),score=63.78 c11605_g2_i1:297-1181(-)